MKKKELKNLTRREVRILDDLGFQDYTKKIVIAFIEDALKNNSIEELHDKGIAQRSLKKLLWEFDPGNYLLKKTKRRGGEKIPKEEIVEMMNLKK
ncbi:MAG: hypothetical protein PF488_00855 [Patescibacteria group bacterium]|jgi:serine/threonine protein kinase|nr:hypothetical protein [Patescibacteria group bacterium]